MGAGEKEKKPCVRLTGYCGSYLGNQLRYWKLAIGCVGA